MDSVNICRELTRALLKEDFHIEWTIPDNHLCPGITGHINYLNEIHELLAVDPDYSKKESAITGIDVGTGASCIYPLLGHCLYTWKFIATDVDPESIANSQYLIDVNHLHQSIRCIQRQKESYMFKDLLEKESSVSFTMCNPPFFSSSDEVRKSDSKIP